MPLHLRFVRLKHGRYRLEARRADGSTTQRELAEGYLPHDLMHLAWEREVGAARSFYGLVAAGGALDADAELREGAEDEAITTEIVVGALQGSVLQKLDAEQALLRARALLEMQGRAVPVDLRADVVARVLAAFRSLAGRFRDLALGDALEVDVEPGARP